MKFHFTLADESWHPLLMAARWFTDLGGKPLRAMAISLCLEEAFKRNDHTFTSKPKGDEEKAADILAGDRGERERGCGRPITNGTTQGTDPSAAAESALPKGA